MKTLVITPLVLKQLAAGRPVEVASMQLRLVPSDQMISNAIREPEAQPATGPICLTCGMLVVPSGSCYKCENCGSTSGCS